MIEILIVLAIVGGLMGMLLGGGLLKSNETRMREAAVEVLGTLRATYGMATMSGTHHRVVFDLDAQKFHIELCRGPQTIRKSEEEEVVDQDALAELMEKIEQPATQSLDHEIVNAGSPEEAAAAAAALAGIRVGTAKCEPAIHGFSGQPAPSGNRHSLDTKHDIRIERIYVQHLHEPVEEGIVTINFFPVGFAEKAIVEVVGEDDDDTYSILVHGMTSRVEFKNGDFDPDDHMRRDGVGDDTEERQ